MYKIHVWFCWLNTFSIVLQFFNIYIGSGEVARQLRALGALEKDLSSVPSTHRVGGSQLPVTSVLGGHEALSWSLKAHTYM